MSSEIRRINNAVRWEGEAAEPGHRAAYLPRYVIEADRSGVTFVSVDGRPVRAAKLTDAEKLAAVCEMAGDMAAWVVALDNEINEEEPGSDEDVDGAIAEVRRG